MEIKEAAFYLLIVVLLLFLTSASLFGQQSSLSGVVKDSTDKQAIVAASVTLSNRSSKQVFASTSTGEDGSFRISNIAPGIYFLEISYIGFKTFQRDSIVLSDNQSLMLGKLLLSVDLEQILQEVVISSSIPTLRLELDKKVFNPEQSIISKGGSASDLLSGIPTLSVDADGNVSMRGVSSVRILIDGKPSAIAGNNIGAYLQSLPANVISRVELLTNPSAKYDPEGQGGIINIVMKKNIRTGFNGSATAGISSYLNYNAGLDLNYKPGKANYFFGYDLRRSNNPGSGYNDNRYSDGSRVYNTSESNWEGMNHNFRFGADYDINDKNSLGISANLNIRDNQRTEDFFYTYYHPDYSILGTSPRNTIQNRNSDGYVLNIDYKKLFKKEGESLTANFSFGDNSDENQQRFLQTASSQLIPIDRDRRSAATGSNQNFNIQLDYVLPIKEGQKFEAGYRSTLQYNDQQQLSDTLALNDSYERDYALSNSFNMDNIVHAAYINYQQKLGKKYTLQAGLRAEQAYLNTEFSGLDPGIEPEDRSSIGKLDYFRVYPGVFLSRTINDDASVQISYTRRVNRPNGWQVNPFLNISDPVNYWQGNPGLLPEDIHSFELGYSHHINKVNITSSIYHRYTRDIIQQIVDSAAVGTNITYSTFQNIGRNSATGIEIVTQLNLNSKLDFLVNANANYQSFGGTTIRGLSFNNGISWDANATVNWKIIRPLSFQLRGGYSAPRITAQGTTFYTITSDAGLRWTVLKEKGTVSFNARNLLNKGARWGAARDLGIMQTEFLRNWMKGPQFGITLNCRFGNSNLGNRERRRNNMDDSNGSGPM